MSDMKYMAKYPVEWDSEMERVVIVDGTISLEIFTDSRIIRIHAKANEIYKVYKDSTCICIKEATR